MTERPIKFWRFTLVFIMIMIGLALSKASFGAEAICFANSFSRLEVTTWAMTAPDNTMWRNDTEPGGLKRQIGPGEEACYVVENGVRLIIKLEVADYGTKQRSSRIWRNIAFFGVGVYDVFIEDDLLRAVVRP